MTSKQDENEFLFELQSELIQSKNQKPSRKGCFVLLFRLALVLVLISIVVIGVLTLLSPTTGAVFSNISTSLAATPAP